MQEDCRQLPLLRLHPVLSRPQVTQLPCIIFSLELPPLSSSHYTHCSRKAERSKVFWDDHNWYQSNCLQGIVVTSLMRTQPKRIGSDKIWKKIPKKHSVRLNQKKLDILYNNVQSALHRRHFRTDKGKRKDRLTLMFPLCFSLSLSYSPGSTKSTNLTTLQNRAKLHQVFISFQWNRSWSIIRLPYHTSFPCPNLLIGFVASMRTTPWNIVKARCPEVYRMSMSSQPSEIPGDWAHKHRGSWLPVPLYLFRFVVLEALKPWEPQNLNRQCLPIETPGFFPSSVDLAATKHPLL